MYNFKDLADIISKLRSSEGCPWDREQTYESMRSCLTDETQEVLQALDNHDMENLCEELGDVLFLLMFYAQLGKEDGFFTIDDVVNGACEKMIRRHPHVFGDTKVNSAEEGFALWQEIKRLEKSKKP